MIFITNKIKQKMVHVFFLVVIFSAAQISWADASSNAATIRFYKDARCDSAVMVGMPCQVVSYGNSNDLFLCRECQGSALHRPPNYPWSTNIIVNGINSDDPSILTDDAVIFVQLSDGTVTKKLEKIKHIDGNLNAPIYLSPCSVAVMPNNTTYTATYCNAPH